MNYPPTRCPICGQLAPVYSKWHTRTIPRAIPFPPAAWRSVIVRRDAEPLAVLAAELGTTAERLASELETWDAHRSIGERIEAPYFAAHQNNAGRPCSASWTEAEPPTQLRLL